MVSLHRVELTHDFNIDNVSRQVSTYDPFLQQLVVKLAMSFDAQKQIRENTLELQEFLKDLKQWESRVKEKDKNLKSQTQNTVSDIPPVRGHGGLRSRHDVAHRELVKAGTPVVQGGQLQEKSRPITAVKHTYDYFRDKWDKFDVDAALREVDKDDSPSSSTYPEEKKKKKAQGASEQVNQMGGSGNKLVSQAVHTPRAEPVSGGGFASMFKSQASDSFVDATTEKEIGNKFFKEKKFVQAIECYSRSIALQPSALSYANRAMAYIKIRRFKEADVDCTEALALDDRYVKAYSRRATARKELGNFLGAVADSEFALRLEPDNKELKEQYINAKAMCEKMMNMNPDEKIPIPVEEIRTTSNAKVSTTEISSSGDPCTKGESAVHQSRMPSVQDVEQEKIADESTESFALAQAVAASVAAARVITNTTLAAPKTFYEFEAVWKSLSLNSSQQAELLKVIKPSTLPQLFKDNLSPKLLGEILRCLEHFFPDTASHAIEILESLTKAKRFNITAMCLSSEEKTELGKLWEVVFTGSQIDEEKVKILCKLRPSFQL